MYQSQILWVNIVILFTEQSRRVCAYSQTVQTQWTEAWVTPCDPQKMKLMENGWKLIVIICPFHN